MGQAYRMLTLSGLDISNWFFREKPKRSFIICGSTSWSSHSRIPRSSMGSVGANVRRRPTNVEMTAGPTVLYQTSTLGM